MNYLLTGTVFATVVKDYLARIRDSCRSFPDRLDAYNDIQLKVIVAIAEGRCEDPAACCQACVAAMDFEGVRC